MNFKKEHIKLKKALCAAYYEKENAVHPGDFWQARVMNHILSLEPLNSMESDIMVLNQFIWRFATAACLLVIVLSVYMFQTGFQPEYEVAKLFINDPMQFIFIHYFGV